MKENKTSYFEVSLSRYSEKYDRKKSFYVSFNNITVILYERRELVILKDHCDYIEKYGKKRRF